MRDCLYLNWALPADAVPDPPAPLRPELHSGDNRSWVFATAVLFRQEGLRWPAVPFVRFSYPQANVRLCVLDADGRPAVLFRRMLMPAWAVPWARLVSQQPVAAARLRFPDLPDVPDGGPWSWEARHGRRLAVVAGPGSPALGPGPRLGSWEAMVELLRERPVGYAESGSGLRRIETAHPPVPVWPMEVEVVETGLLEDAVPLAGGARWPPLYSAFLCPRVPLRFATSQVPEVAFRDRLPAPS